MIRVLIALVAVLVAVLAFVFDQPWLYGIAAVVLIGALGYLTRHFWMAYQDTRVSDETTADSSPDPASQREAQSERRDEPMAEAGASLDDDVGGAADASEPEEGADAEPTGTAVPDDEGLDEEGDDWTDEIEDWPEEVGEEAEEDVEEALTEEEEKSASQSYEHPVLGPFLESLRAAIGAQSVALLVQEEVALEYRIEALASVQPDVQHTGTFETQEPLLTATMSRQSVTVRSLDNGGEDLLKYYDTVPAIRQVALAPVSRPDSSSTVFLMADATAEVDLEASQSRTLLERFSKTIAVLLDADEPGGNRGGAFVPDDAREVGDAPDVPSDANGTADTEADEADDDEPRPRREIIAEEMRAADAASEGLALVLVHLNRAESIARRGEEAVTSAERHLRSRLEHLAPGQRVERFGELTYGVFVRGAVDQVEEWGADLQDAMAKEQGELEGGVSVGVAVRDRRHDPEGLRTDATDALLEAYETGTCTIIA